MHIPHRLAAVAATLGLLAGAPALAADASATVQITSVQFSTSGGLSLQWLPGSSFQALFAESREAGGLGGNDLAEPGSSDSWSDQSVSTAVAHAMATAQAGANGLLAAAASANRSIFDALHAQPHTGNSWVQQSGWFQLSGAGTLTVTVGYTLSAAAPLADGNDSFAGATLQLQAGNLDLGTSGLAEDMLWSFDLPTGSASRSGLLSLTVELSDPLQTGFYDLRANADVSAIATVPEPNSWALMALGGVALAGLARQRRREA